MNKSFSSFWTVVCLLVLLGFAQASAVEEPDAAPAISAESLSQWGNSEVVFAGTLDRVVAGPVGLSLPPVRTHQLHFTVEEVLRGDSVDKQVVCSHVVRQEAVPTFPTGKKVLVAADRGRDSFRVLTVLQQTDEELAQVRQAMKIPLGWSIENQRLVSPWASLGDQAWSDKNEKNESQLVCSKTGRPAHLGGAELRFQVQKVPPAKEIEWTNPDGDGQYRITVSNPTEHTMHIPALLATDTEVLWSESLLIRCQGRTYIMPDAKGVSEPVKPVVLMPGESLSTVVNVLKLDGPEWPRGGYRIEFQFCLGEKSNVQSFYYMSRHHDKLRESLNKK
jgi:hypothetical protein